MYSININEQYHWGQTKNMKNDPDSGPNKHDSQETGN